MSGRYSGRRHYSPRLYGISLKEEKDVDRPRFRSRSRNRHSHRHRNRSKRDNQSKERIDNRGYHQRRSDD